MKTDTRSHLFIENNDDYIEESGFYKTFQIYDEYLKPSFSFQTKYDVCTGSQGAYTPLRYHTYYRQYYMVTTGKIHVKMTPWKSHKYLHTYNDYDNYEFYSPVNVWEPQKKYVQEMERIRFLEFDVHPGYVLYIPPYWWYSIKYTKGTDTVVAGFKYDSVMNALAHSNEWVLHFIQQQNIKQKMTKTLDTVASTPSANDSASTTDTTNHSDTNVLNQTL
jgi:hypothetical protein